MKNFLLVFFYFQSLLYQAYAQSDTDTVLQKNDSSKTIKSTKKPPILKTNTIRLPEAANKNQLVDSTAEVINLRSVKSNILEVKQMLSQHPYFHFFGSPLIMQPRKSDSGNNEALFYFLLGLLLYFSLVKLLFGKYLNNLLTLFFRVTMRQQQLREQVLLTPLPSLFLNILFVVAFGLYLTFLAFHYKISPVDNMWFVLLWCIMFIMAIYMGKFLVLKMTGWIFNITNATDTYIFIVFLVNKMIGIFLLPFLVLIAYPSPYLINVIMTLSYVLIIGLFIYRFFISYRSIRNELNVTQLHFFLYLCAFEIAPLLLIYKVLLAFVERSY